PAIERGPQERTVTDRGIALLRVAAAVVPHGQHVRARQRVLREDVTEQTTPGGEVPLEGHLHGFAATSDAADVLPPERIDVVLVLGIDGRLPRELPVLTRDLRAVTPLGVLADV